MLRDNSGETPGPVNNAQEVPLNQDASAIRYVLGNDSESKIFLGSVTIGPLLTIAQDGSFTGLQVNELRLSAPLVDHSEIKSITLTDDHGNILVVPKEKLTVNSDGEILLSQQVYVRTWIFLFL